MTIIRNSAKCTACGTEIESTHGHDFNVHHCKVEPTPEKTWTDDNRLIETGGTTWRFAVDGGKNYIRRVGEGFQDTSEYTE